MHPALRHLPSVISSLLLLGCSTLPPGGDPSARLPRGPTAGDQYLSPFYDWKGPVPAKPGVPLRMELMPGQPEINAAAEMRRVLYTSLDARWNSGALPVSGAVYLPKGQPPAGGWPVVAWAHGTLGVADMCAPSWTKHRPRDATYMNRWLQQGYAVVATDYQGLGGPGPHPYLFWEAEGRSVLDSVRAVLAAYPQQLANDVVITGQSQGSGAALGAATIASRYAPELHIRATIATGVASTFPQGPVPLGAEDSDQSWPPRFKMLRLIGGSLPEGGPTVESLLTDKGQRVLSLARSSCVDDIRAVEQREGITKDNAFKQDGATLMGQLIAATDMTPVRLPMPLFVGTGLADKTVSPHRQYAAVAALCAAGNPLVWKRYPGISHNGVVNAAFDDELQFVRGIKDGTVPASNCGVASDPGRPEPVTPGILFND